MRTAALIAFFLSAVALTSAGDKYPLTMTAVFTKGHSVNLSKDATFQSGDYRCTKGDENHAPECHTLEEWAGMDSIAGEPDTVVFTLADGSQVGVQSRTVKKIPGFIVCDAGSDVIFCDLYFDFLTRQQINPTKKTPYGQTEYMSGDEMQVAQEARNRALFGNGKTMSLTYRYKTKGKPQDGFQRIEVDKGSCFTDENNINHCASQSVTHLLNPKGDGYVLNSKVDASLAAQ